MKEAELCALAKEQIGLLDKSPDSTVPKSYLDELKTHVGLYPHDTNFRVRIDAKEGTASITCFEGGCNGMVVPAGGKPQGLNDVFRLYRRHALTYLPHQQSREERLKAVQTCSLPNLKEQKRPVTRPGESSLLKVLDTNTPPSSRTTSLSTLTPPIKTTTPAAQQAGKRVSSLTRVKCIPTVAEVTKGAGTKEQKGNHEPSTENTPDSQIEPLTTAKRLHLIHIRGQIALARDRIAAAREAKAALTTKTTVADKRKMAHFDNQILLDSCLVDKLNLTIDSIMNNDPYESTQLYSTGSTYISPIQQHFHDVPETEHSFATNSSSSAYTSSQYDPGQVSAFQESISAPAALDTKDGLLGHSSVPIASTSSLANALEMRPTPNYLPSNLSPFRDVATRSNSAASDEIPIFASYDDGEDVEMHEYKMGLGPQSDDISKFLIMAGNSEHFDGNTTVEKAFKQLGLKTQYDMLPGMAVALMPHQTIGVSWMIDKEENLKGGALSDEMGLGKTVQMIALMVKNRSTDPSLKTNLIIAPAALLDQWKLEIELKTNNTLSCLIYHGSSKPKRQDVLLNYDVVLTTYQTMALEWPDYEKEARKERDRQRKRKKEVNPVQEDSDDDVQYTAKKRKIQTKGLLFDVEFYRVVLDEAQNIRNKRTRMSRAVTELQATYRWCLTGTPVINSLTDVYPYLRFIRVRPWHDWTDFRLHIASLEKKRPQVAATRLQAIVATFMLRRMKNSLLDGKRLIELPEKTVSMIRLEFSPEEREVYKMVEIRSQAKFNKFLRAGTVLKNYHQVLVLLLRLRQVCVHPTLITEDGRAYLLPGEQRKDNEDKRDELARARTLVSPQFVEKMKNKLKDAATARLKAEKESLESSVEDDECPICFDLLTDAVVTPCTHVFCRECIMDVLNTLPVEVPDNERGHPCPSCRSPISKGRLFSRAAFEATVDEDNASCTKTEEDDDDLSDFIVPDGEVSDERDQGTCGWKKTGGQWNEIESDDEEDNKEDVGIIFGAGPATSGSKSVEIMSRFLPSTKMKYMMESLEKTFKDRPDEKVLVISQWTACLSLVSEYLTERSILHVKFQGDMKRQERDRAVREFMSKNRTRVMLMSLKCGGIGLNLTRANNVINLDLAWSQAIESQAFDRVHRLGQRKAVYVERLVIANTVEDRVLELQQRKQTLADGSLGEGTGKKMKRLNVRELANLFGLDIHGRRNTDY